jgi:hypothetical protein
MGRMDRGALVGMGMGVEVEVLLQCEVDPMK